MNTAPQAAQRGRGIVFFDGRIHIGNDAGRTEGALAADDSDAAVRFQLTTQSIGANG
jgi:hypothetical protein